MRLFVDCEFTDFIDCDLISLALVADDGREFYGERSDFKQASCSAFVREAVLPQLSQFPGCVFTREALRTALLTWLAQFACEPERVLCFDYGGDWDLLVELVGEVPSGWQACHVGASVDVALDWRPTSWSTADDITPCTTPVHYSTAYRRIRSISPRVLTSRRRSPS